MLSPPCILRSWSVTASLTCRAVGGLCRGSQRQCHASASQMTEAYELEQTRLNSLLTDSHQIHPRAVFANNELALHDVNVYGFDYDYTLVVYRRQLNELIYDLARDRLIADLKYPDGLRSVPYDAEFAIRGLHYDVRNCCLLKMDAFSQVQLGTVHRGRRALSDAEVHSLYPRLSVPDAATREGTLFPQLVDFFSLPWAGLLSSVVEYFDENRITFDPACLYNDVEESVRRVHQSGEMYSHVMQQIPTFVHHTPELRVFLDRLKQAGKSLFIVTNSPFFFVNAGMTYILGPDWRSLFSFIIVKANKPGFFQNRAPFRLYDPECDSLSFARVHDLKTDAIYSGGNIEDLSSRCGFGNGRVIYFGDHILTDLAHPMLQLGWRTVAVVPELSREIRIQNGEQHQRNIIWLQLLTALIERFGRIRSAEEREKRILNDWREERLRIQTDVKHVFNPRFGSTFRTYHQMSYFSRRLCRLSDVYTSRVTNFLAYPTHHAFFPRRNALPHEQLHLGPTSSETGFPEGLLSDQPDL